MIHESEDYKDLKISFFDDWARWNYYTKYLPSKTKTKDPIVVYHYSSSTEKGSDHGAPRQQIEGCIV